MQGCDNRTTQPYNREKWTISLPIYTDNTDQSGAGLSVENFLSGDKALTFPKSVNIRGNPWRIGSWASSWRELGSARNSY